VNRWLRVLISGEASKLIVEQVGNQNGTMVTQRWFPYSTVISNANAREPWRPHRILPTFLFSVNKISSTDGGLRYIGSAVECRLWKRNWRKKQTTHLAAC